MYKIGHCANVESRVASLSPIAGYEIKILYIIPVKGLFNCKQIESQLHSFIQRKFRFKYRAKRVLASGNSELYSWDVLQLDL